MARAADFENLNRFGHPLEEIRPMGQPRQPVASSIGAITSEVEGTTREQNLCWLGEAGQLLEEDGGREPAVNSSTWTAAPVGSSRAAVKASNARSNDWGWPDLENQSAEDRFSGCYSRLSIFASLAAERIAIAMDGSDEAWPAGVVAEHGPQVSDQAGEGGL